MPTLQKTASAAMKALDRLEDDAVDIEAVFKQAGLSAAASDFMGKFAASYADISGLDTEELVKLALRRFLKDRDPDRILAGIKQADVDEAKVAAAASRLLDEQIRDDMTDYTMLAELEKRALRIGGIAKGVTRALGRGLKSIFRRGAGRPPVGSAMLGADEKILADLASRSGRAPIPGTPSHPTSMLEFVDAAKREPAMGPGGSLMSGPDMSGGAMDRLRATYGRRAPMPVRPAARPPTGAHAGAPAAGGPPATDPRGIGTGAAALLGLGGGLGTWGLYSGAQSASNAFGNLAGQGEQLEAILPMIAQAGKLDIVLPAILDYQARGGKITEAMRQAIEQAMLYRRNPWLSSYR